MDCVCDIVMVVPSGFRIYDSPCSYSGFMGHGKYRKVYIAVNMLITLAAAHSDNDYNQISYFIWRWDASQDWSVLCDMENPLSRSLTWCALFTCSGL